MYRNKRILAIVPARGGSKGLPRKNIKPLAKKPLIAWTINEARKSKYIDRLIVSTDDKEIAEISRKYGAEVPFLRPRELAADNSKSIDVILHALEWLENKRVEIYDLVILLQPTSPLRISKDINNALKLLFSKKEARVIVSVCKAEQPSHWTGTLPANGCMKDFSKDGIRNMSRQELPTFYRLNGAIYLAYRDYLKEQKSFFGNKTFAYVMPVERSVDIDNEMDFKLAEILKKEIKHNNFVVDGK